MRNIAIKQAVTRGSCLATYVEKEGRGTFYHFVSHKRSLGWQARRIMILQVVTVLRVITQNV